ncbi:hypothetical protein SCHPADRAFT_943272 [Schizopora paradoxa]|uniref:Uncharacterized protein n=1 Tax=Schizopora paradoxa TaxID=27342 RepID=A0A0H2RYW1_9AGAM|nr:hypothetical protein SCHPADRAFT_943272 [Schizopora paradoxa]
MLSCKEVGGAVLASLGLLSLLASTPVQNIVLSAIIAVASTVTLLRPTLMTVCAVRKSTANFHLVWSMYKKAEASSWTAEEVDLSKDVVQ